MTRRIAFLASLPGDIADSEYAERVYQLFDSARIYNKEHQINGAFLVHHNTLFQVLEGASGELAKYVYRTSRDPRLSSVSVILNREVARPLFNRWTIKLLNEGHSTHAEFLEKLHYALKSQWLIQQEKDKNRLAEFFPARSKENIHTAVPVPIVDYGTRYRKMALSMKAWPRPTQLRLTADLIKLCPRLVGRKIGYQRLLEMKIFSSEEKLIEQLQLLDHIHVLEISPANQTLATPAVQEQPAAGGSLFSQALRKFIHARTDRGVH